MNQLGFKKELGTRRITRNSWRIEEDMEELGTCEEIRNSLEEAETQREIRNSWMN